uniref:glucuronosyltransferase n=1 Tax=Angiostrongylus cantonensis TaxID=6313 RepID=A0A0K0D0S9_ANGCA
MIRRLMALCSMLNISCSLHVLLWNPTIGSSHVRFMGNIADILVGDGHDVNQRHALMGICHNRGAKLHHEWYGEVPFYDEKRLFEDAEFLNDLRAAKFDVALYELYDWSAVAMIGIKRTVLTSALGFTPHIQQVIGFAANPSYVPGLYTSYSDEMSFWERLDNFKFAIEMHYRLISWQLQLHALANKVFPGFPHLQDLIKENSIATYNLILTCGSFENGALFFTFQKLSAILERRIDNVLFSLGSLATSKGMPMWLKQGLSYEVLEDSRNREQQHSCSLQ